MTLIKKKWKTFSQNKEELKENEKKKEEEKKKKNVSKIKKDSDIEYAKSVRDAIRKNIRNRLYNKRDPDTISPVLPIELDLTILGNSFLKIGDQYNINYLPSQYKDKTFFQICLLYTSPSPRDPH